MIAHDGIKTFRQRKTPETVLIPRVLNGKARQCPTFTGNTTNYHRPRSVSLSCSEWEGVVPPRYGRRAKPVVSEVHQLNSRDEVFAKRSERRNAIICIHCASKSIVRFSTASH